MKWQYTLQSVFRIESSISLSSESQRSDLEVEMQCNGTAKGDTRSSDGVKLVNIIACLVDVLVKTHVADII